jgi:hypothetical protein
VTSDLLTNPLRAYANSAAHIGEDGDSPEYNINFSLKDELGLKNLTDGGFFD